ncbi:MAG: hypothetical protein ACKO1U_00610 [Bacteroidota bacterium]
MSLTDNSSLIQGLRASSNEALDRFTKRYFQSTRRWMRRQGVRDSDTPRLFADMLVGIIRFLQVKKVSGPMDLELLMRECIRENVKGYKGRNKAKEITIAPDGISVTAARCFSALDEQAQQLLEAYYVQGFKFEEIADRFGFGNAAIAEFEIDRAMELLENLVNVSVGKSLSR